MLWLYFTHKEWWFIFKKKEEHKRRDLLEAMDNRRRRRNEREGLIDLDEPKSTGDGGDTPPGSGLKISGMGTMPWLHEPESTQFTRHYSPLIFESSTLLTPQSSILSPNPKITQLMLESLFLSSHNLSNQWWVSCVNNKFCIRCNSHSSAAVDYSDHWLSAVGLFSFRGTLLIASLLNIINV